MVTAPAALKGSTYFSIVVILSLFTASVFIPKAYAQQYRSEAKTSTNVGNPPISGGSKGLPPTNNTCPNSPFHKYYLIDFQKNTVFSPKNFGDPICDYTRTGLAALIHSL